MENLDENSRNQEILIYCNHERARGIFIILRAYRAQKKILHKNHFISDIKLTIFS